MVTKNYVKEKEKIIKFINEYSDTERNKEEGCMNNSSIKYKECIIKIANRERNIIYIELDDVIKFDEELCVSIIENTKRYTNIFTECIMEILGNYKMKEHKSTLDIFIEHRKIAEEISKRNQQLNKSNEKSKYPIELLKNFDILFKHLSSQKILSVREILANKIGKLVKFKGIVTRCTEVKPLITVAAYLCDRCGGETFQTISASSFTPLESCPIEECSKSKVSFLHLQSRGSKFVKHQELKIQELSDQVPAGHVPRYITVYIYGDLTRIALPGNSITITGIFLPIAKKGFRQIISGLIADTYIEAHEIIVNLGYEIHVDEINDPKYISDYNVLLNEDNLYEKLSLSIAPEIYGHDDIKKALLLLMVGGVDKNPRGLKIRGNINILIVGDPGVAKSQLLSYISRINPRSQLTTGKGSSGVGLTAAVMKDPLTGELILEGGSLVLSDGGVCCIDEFDKMDENDRTAIHEVMEQQTISIAKAGIITTLNARVSILAAANPSYGRYNPKKTIEQNIQLPAALLSRFDLIWIIRDKPDSQIDTKLAQHITYVHQHRQCPISSNDIFSISTLRSFIQSCKDINPVIPEYLKEYIVTSYITMRKESRLNYSTYMSARTLLSILRLSTALARLRHSKLVAKEDVQEAIRLMDSSKLSIEPDDVKFKNTKPHDIIFGIIRELALVNTNTSSISYEEVTQQCIAKGFTIDQISQCIQDYQDLNVLYLNSTKTDIILV